MTNRVVYVNGEFVPEDKASISIFDRGFLFADSVYEVSSVLDGKLIDNAAHLSRLGRSLSELGMPMPMSASDLADIMKQLVTCNKLREGLVYIQVSRGVADRDFSYADDLKPGLVMFTQSKSLINSPAARVGISVVFQEDIRWQRRDIKTTQLLAPVMAKAAAKSVGKDDAWLVMDGLTTEGSSNNAWIVKNGILITRPLSNDILAGITRAAVTQLVTESDLQFQERPFSPEEAMDADEAFVTSATTFVTPVTEIAGKQIGDGKPGNITRGLRDLYIQRAQASI